MNVSLIRLLVLITIYYINNANGVEITQEIRDKFEKWKKEYGQYVSNDEPKLKYGLSRNFSKV